MGTDSGDLFTIKVQNGLRISVIICSCGTRTTSVILDIALLSQVLGQQKVKDFCYSGH